mmetsp:Transcript_25888/g.41661  ORF Transcript_25888/g.41661 Transcript_25888/m.41661 type:complete len:111 (-) Transcript_25888:863-1195(-)
MLQFFLTLNAQAIIYHKTVLGLHNYTTFQSSLEDFNSYIPGVGWSILLSGVRLATGVARIFEIPPLSEAPLSIPERPTATTRPMMTVPERAPRLKKSEASFSGAASSFRM